MPLALKILLKKKVDYQKIVFSLSSHSQSYTLNSNVHYSFFYFFFFLLRASNIENHQRAPTSGQQVRLTPKSIGNIVSRCYR